jgi:peptide/nickel transport system permease protein
LTPPGGEFLMGADNLGRDVWTRFLYGGRISLSVGISACLIGATIGVILGALAGYYGGWLDAFFVWVSEVLLAFPGILLALIVVAVLGAGIVNTIVAVGIALIPSFLRMARGSVMSARHEVYVEAARVVGARDTRILFRHILPNVGRPLLTLLTLGVGGAILEGAALSFLGLGAQPPSPEWGAMLNAGQNFMRVGWWIGLFPGLGIFLTVLAVNLVGDGLSERS